MKLDELLKDFQRCKDEASTKGCEEVMDDIEARLKLAVKTVKDTIDTFNTMSYWMGDKDGLVKRLAIQRDLLKGCLKKIEEPG